MSSNRSLRWLGTALILAGLGILAWVAWQMWGTTWVAQREQQGTVAKVERAADVREASLIEVTNGFDVFKNLPGN